MQQISIILTGVKGQIDNKIAVIHISTNPYNIASVRSVLLNVEARQSDMLFDPVVAANVVVNQSASSMSYDSVKSAQIFAPGDGLLPTPSAALSQFSQ